MQKGASNIALLVQLLFLFLMLLLFLLLLLLLLLLIQTVMLRPACSVCFYLKTIWMANHLQRVHHPECDVAKSNHKSVFVTTGIAHQWVKKVSKQSEVATEGGENSR